MARIAPFALLAFLALGAYAYHRAAAKAPDRYAPCAKLSDPVEKERCRSQIDFALAAGW